jgi:hypothetical protein
MNEQYEMTYHLLGKHRADNNSRGGSVRDTQAQAEWVALEHYAQNEGRYAYKIMKCVLVEGEGWHRVGATYILNGCKVSEEAWLKEVWS